MDRVLLQSSDGACAAITLQGAHLLSWIPAGGHEQLFMSKTSVFSEGVAIRGGVPIIFPQFASLGALPKHGFARTALWRLVHNGVNAGGAGQARLELTENIARLLQWPHVFRVELTVTIAADTLHMNLLVENRGDTPLSFTAALHSYFAVHQIGDVQVQGLQGLLYRDTVSGADRVVQEESALTIASEIDRIYSHVHEPIILQEGRQQLRITQTGFRDAVVWNPGVEKGAQLDDLEPDGYQRMLCIEAAAAVQAIHLAPGAVWSGTQFVQRLC